MAIVAALAVLPESNFPVIVHMNCERPRLIIFTCHDCGETWRVACDDVLMPKYTVRCEKCSARMRKR